MEFAIAAGTGYIGESLFFDSMAGGGTLKNTPLANKFSPGPVNVGCAVGGGILYMIATSQGYSGIPVAVISGLTPIALFWGTLSFQFGASNHF